MKQKLIVLLTTLVLSASVLSGCNGSSAVSEDYSASSTSDYAAGEMAEEPVNAGFYKSEVTNMNQDIVSEDEIVADSDVVSEDAAERETTAEQPVQRTEKKIVYSGDISIETTDYDKTVDELKTYLKDMGAIVSSSTESDDNSTWYYSDSKRHSSRHIYWQLRIPADKFNPFFEKIGNITGSVRSKNVYSSDMTKQYGDTKVQIESLTIQQNNLLKMMESAESIEDMLAIEDRLTQVRSELYRLNNSNNQIDYDVQYSQVSLSVTEVYEYPAEEPETFRERLINSIKDSAKDFIEFLQDALVCLVYIFPYIPIVLILLWLLMKIGDKTGKSRKGLKRKEKKGKISPDTDKEQVSENKE